jgi:hypothetical protein
VDQDKNGQHDPCGARRRHPVWSGPYFDRTPGATRRA